MNTSDFPSSFESLIQDMRDCHLCADHLPFDPHPVFQAGASARVLIVGQAPGMRAHMTGTPFNDASGDRLRKWLGVAREEFYDPSLFAIVPMGLCYPGTNVRAGDKPPCSTCCPFWHPQIKPYLQNMRLVVLVGQYAQAYYLKGLKKDSLTRTVAAWREYVPDFLPLPHPSWRNTGWIKKNPWFEREVIPFLQQKVRDYIRPEDLPELQTALF